MVFSSFCSWIGDQSLLSIIYWIIVIPASAIFLVQLLLSFRNPDTKKNNTISNTEKQNIEIGFELFRFRNIIGFFTALGWSGLASIDAGLSNESTILVSFICGIAMMFAMATIFYFMRKLLDSVSEGF